MKFTIQDTGIGIKEKDLVGIFEPFEQIRDERNPPYFRGWGLGLPIAKGFVEKMNGKVGVESIYGSESTFWFTLPLEGSSGKT